MATVPARCRASQARGRRWRRCGKTSPGPSSTTSSGWRWLKWLLGASVAGLLALLLILGLALALAFPKLPDVAALADYRVQVAVAAQDWSDLPAGDVLAVSVTVIDPAGQSLLLSGYRTRY